MDELNRRVIRARRAAAGAGIMLFIAGAVVGAAAALILAPATGADTRAFIGRRGKRAGRRRGAQGQEAVERARRPHDERGAPRLRDGQNAGTESVNGATEHRPARCSRPVSAAALAAAARHAAGGPFRCAYFRGARHGRALRRTQARCSGPWLRAMMRRGRDSHVSGLRPEEPCRRRAPGKGALRLLQGHAWPGGRADRRRRQPLSTMPSRRRRCQCWWTSGPSGAVRAAWPRLK